MFITFSNKKYKDSKIQKYLLDVTYYTIPYDR